MRKIFPALAAGVVLVGGAGAFGVNEALASDVTVTVDGQSRQVTTWPATVGEVLAKQGVTVGEHDTVAPSVTSKVSDGTEISVRYGRPVTVVLDGQERTQWVTATTVDEALGLFGIRGDVQVSTSRSSAIGRDGLRLEVTTPRGVTVTADGKTTPVSTYGTVTDALTQAAVSLGGLDQVTPALSEPVTEGMQVVVTRVELRDVAKQSAVPFEKQTKEDANLPKGTTQVVQAGATGTADELWTQEVRDGQVVNEVKKSSTVSKAPVTEITAIGTKAVSSAPASASPTSSTTAPVSSNATTKAPAPATTTKAPVPAARTTAAPAAPSTSLAPATGNSCGVSFYDEGQMTATGEVFNPNAMTAAHKTLPFGTKVKVTNPATGKSVIVRINDRGPYIGGRCLDLSRAAFAAIAPLSAGHITATWEVVG